MITYDSVSKYFTSTLLSSENVFAAFATRAQGDGKHRFENIFSFLKSNDINYKKVVMMEQIHSVNVVFYRSKGGSDFVKLEDTDGVITDENNLALTTVTADCLPILYKDDTTGLIAASHQGWRGSLKRMPQKIVHGLLSRGAKLSSIKVSLGPAIGECCYDIDEDRYWEFRQEFDGYSDKIFHHHRGKLHLNLTYLNYLLLKEIGIVEMNIDHFPFCTKCDSARFFSYRKEKQQLQGEMFSLIVKT